MSYTLSDNCYNCKKRETCTDQKKVQNAIDNIHGEPYSDEMGHQGGGTIILFCCNHDQ